jgi:NAD(P)H-dependent FMN reductase
MRILSVCGSLQQKSGNLTLLRRAAVLAPETRTAHDGRANVLARRGHKNLSR